ncbi:MAG TPA: hydroxyethylthiazole kinase [Dyella sp.]|uniref:hydroxyethylthiazole kinase n=1 Tax=Dyella sp. TaxID=1869338 RepID=UPI002F938384
MSDTAYPLDTMTAALHAARQRSPLVHCITNFVAMNMAANAVLAIGASPAMVHAEEEAAEFAAIADALTVNIGTLSSDWLAGMLAAATSAQRNGKPWVLDPVAHQATAFRREATARLLALRPAAIRGNASEILALSGGASRAQGVDSRDAVEVAEEGAVRLARTLGTVIAVTGEVDFLTDGERSLRFAGGSPWMPRVTAMGCAQTCVMGALLAVLPGQPFEAAATALAMFKQAGERAARDATGPGSFHWRFIDTLAAIDELQPRAP